MREIQIIATCSRKNCHETWKINPGDEAVTIKLSDGSTYELDLCFTHEQRLKTDWLDGLVTAPVKLAQAQPKGSKKKRRIADTTPRDLECPMLGCASRPSNFSSMRAHLRQRHVLSGVEVADLMHEKFGTRKMSRVMCPDCKDTYAAQNLARHREKEHGVVT